MDRTNDRMEPENHILPLNSSPMQIPTTEAKRTLPAWFDAAIVVVVTVAIYAQVLGHSFIFFDDPSYVMGNQHVLEGLTPSSFIWAWSNFDSANYHPLTWISYLIDIELFGPRAGCIALENAIFHALNGWLVARILGELGCSRWGALFGALAFVAHPLNVESVAWVSERKTVLAAAFGFVAILDYLRRTRQGRPPIGWGVTLSLCASLLCKPWFVVLPGLFLVFDLWPLRRLTPPATGEKPTWQSLRTNAWPLFREKISLLALVLAMSVGAIIAQHAQGAVVSLDSIPLGQRLQTACVATAAYLSDTFRLGGFSLYYPQLHSLPLTTVLATAGLLVGLSAVAITLARRHPVLLAAWLWFLLFLLPVVGLVQVGGQSRADRYMYLPLVGLLWAMVSLAERAWIVLRSALRPLLPLAAGIWVALLAMVAYRQTSLWRNSFGIVGHSIAVSGASARLVGILGIAHLQANRWQEAIPLLERSLHDDPSNTAVALNLAYTYGQQGRLDEAITLVTQVLVEQPDNYMANSHLARFLRQRGESDRAKDVERHLATLVTPPGYFAPAPVQSPP